MDKLQRIEEKQKQWEPEGGEFLCHHTGFIVDSNKDDFASKINGCAYKTGKQAEKAAAAMRTHNRLLAYVAEFAPDYEFAFGKENWYVCNLNGGDFSAGGDIYIKDVGKVYMPKDVALELRRKLNSGEVVL